MKLARITAQGYQGINYLDLEIEKPITLIAGKNGAGKTSVRDAIQFAMTGESSRVSMKKDYGSLVRIGADPKKAFVELVTDMATYKRQVATGKGETPDYPLVLPYLLGSARFALLPAAEQAKLLFAATGVKRDADTVKKMLLERRVDEGVVQRVMPMIRAGFAAAVKECKAKQSEARGAWQAVTEENFGAAKAEGWKADRAKAAPVPLAELEEARSNMMESVPALEKQIAELEAEKDAMVQHTHTSGTVYTCPECETELLIMRGQLVKDERDGEPEPDLESQKILISRLNKAREELGQLQQQIGRCDAQIAAAKDADRICEERTKKAAQYFQEWKDWGQAADELSPSGIPLALLEAGLKPINERLESTAKAAGWKEIKIHPDLSISYGGIPYNLCSESEQWRIDAGITEALSRLSGAKMFVLDRMDVLFPPDRVGLLKWLVSVAGEHDTILVMATLKEPPAKLPASIQGVWLEENGERLEEAA